MKNKMSFTITDPDDEYVLTSGNSSSKNDKVIYAHTGGWDKASDAITEAVNHPPHYNKGNIETIDYIVDVLDTHGALMYCHGNVLKYTGSRLFSKGKTVEDARKAIWYLNKIVEIVESND
tara:strand:+ start:1409 stop:1768 length:360 start_codon:yes stop_codon:yes gene_type:complete